MIKGLGLLMTRVMTGWWRSDRDPFHALTPSTDSVDVP